VSPHLFAIRHLVAYISYDQFIRIVFVRLLYCHIACLINYFIRTVLLGNWKRNFCLVCPAVCVTYFYLVFHDTDDY